MERSQSGGKRNVVKKDSSPGIANIQHTTSDGSEIHGETSLAQHETGRGKSRKNRIIFNAAQLNALERLFQDVAYPDMELRSKIAQRLDIDESRVTVWFQNRRAKYRRSAQKGTNDSNADLKKGQINSPASTGSHEPSLGEQSPYAPPGVQNFAQNIPVSGVEYSTWVNHSYSGGDQSTVVHQSRGTKQTFHNDGDRRIQDLRKDDSNQQRTLEWLRDQNSEQTSPRDVAESNPQSQKSDAHQPFQRLEEIPSQQQPRDIRESTNQHERNGSSAHGSTVVRKSPSHSYNDGHTVYQGNDSRAQSRSREDMPPNKDVQELQSNHLGEALERLGAGHNHSTGSGTPLLGVQHSPFPAYPGNMPSHIQPYPSPFHGYPSNFPLYDASLRPVHMASPSRQYHYSPDFISFPSPQINQMNLISQNSDKPVFYRTRDLYENSFNDVRLSNEKLSQRDLNTSSRTHQLRRPSPSQDNRKRPRSFSDESDDSRCVRKKRRKRKFRKRRRKIRKDTNRTEISLAELANPNRHNHAQFDSDKEKNGSKYPSRGRKYVRTKLRRQVSSSWDEAGSSSGSEKRSSSSSIFSSTSDSDFEIPYCKLTRNQRMPLSQQRPHFSPNNGLPQLASAAGSVKTIQYAGSKDSSISHYEGTISSATAVSRSTMDVPALHYKESIEQERRFDTRRNATGKPQRDENERSKSPKGQEQDFEPTTFLNLLFGPKSPEIPSGNFSDEDEQVKQLQKQKGKNDDILSESWQIAQNFSSSTADHPVKVKPSMSTYTQQTSASYQNSDEYPSGHPAQGPPYNLYNSHGQFTLHYGKNDPISSMKSQNRPRGIIRPLPQKPSATSAHHLTDSTSYDTQGRNFQKCSTASLSPSKRVTGTVRPWVDDTPRATSNPEQDISRPVREPVPMEGPPPNKVCTIVKDSLSPIDLLAKYLTWTGSCYTAQKYH